MDISHPNLNNAKRIAVVRTDRLGDMVLTLPMCSALKHECPKATIILITRSYVASLLYRCSVIDEVVYADTIEEVTDAIRTGNFDAIFFPRPQFSEYFAAFRARIPLRVGSGYRWYSFLINCKQYDHRKTADYHEAEFNTRLVSRALGKEVATQLVAPVVKPDSAIRIHELFAFHNISNLTPIVIHPGSGGSAVNWPAENFGKTAKRLHELTNRPIIITGIETETEICKIVYNNCPQAINLCGKLSLDDLIALLANASLLIANSTGVLHVAAALGTPVLGLYPNSPPMSAKRWGPFTQNSIVISPPNGDDSMSDISVESVALSALNLLNY
ncbi:MAG: glycosyltransferase family 9 protein [Ignavibacteria bacterium]|nr:glycosyltransferase family 9 protein [Ignavibacteria bacterium]